MRCWSPDHTLRVCPGALWRSFLFIPSDAYKLLLISAVCSDSFPTSPPAGLVHTCFACLQGGFLLGSACWAVSQYSPCAVATMDLLSCLASAWGAASGSHAGQKALTEKHQKHRPGNISLPADPWRGYASRAAPAQAPAPQQSQHSTVLREKHHPVHLAQGSTGPKQGR